MIKIISAWPAKPYQKNATLIMLRGACCHARAAGVFAMNHASPNANGPTACCAADGKQAAAPKFRPGGRLAAIGAPLLAFLASQHHTIMMGLFAFGLSDAAMGFMTAAPLVRDAMLGMSLAMVGVVAWQIRDKRRPAPTRVAGAVSILVTLALAAWSIVYFGM
jgi:hypothetical protein